MSGLCFKSNFYKKVDEKLFIDATRRLKHRGPDNEGFLFLDDFSFGVMRLAIIDKKNGIQPASKMNNHLIFDGAIFNQEEIKSTLKKNTYDTYSDTEVLLNCLIEKGTQIINKIDGTFAFVYTCKNKVVAARDHFGFRPLYYTIIDNDIFIASEIKSILEYQKEAVVNIDGLKELLGLGPMHSIGKTVYKGIYELPMGHYLTFDKKNGLKIFKYFDLVAKPHNLNLNETIIKTKELVTNAIKKQIKSDDGISCLLSGGLDSSVIVLTALEELGQVDTYSIDYEDNKEEFISNDFEISNDQNYINYVINKRNIKHNFIKISTENLVKNLEKTLEIKDYPGMADIDSSLYYLCNEVKKNHNVVLSGECADEIFGGYPWFYKKMEYDTFPWIRNIEERENLLNSNLREKINLKEYLKEVYLEIANRVPVLESDTIDEVKERELLYLNIMYCMTTLGERKDRMSMGASVEARVPFADKELIEFLYNVPFHQKYYNETEKMLLRDAMKDILPIEIYERKKSPYPKSRSRKYHEKVVSLLEDALKNESSILYQIFDCDSIKEMMYSDEELKTPWYGQLMRKTQLLVFIYQIDYWFKTYNIKLEI